MRNAHRFVRTVLVSVLVAVALLGTGSAATAGRLDGIAPATLPASVLEPAAGAVVGVAHPVTVRFETPVADRHAAERAIEIATSKPVDGRFVWLDERRVQWTPDRFWPGDTTVTVSVAGARTEFQVGDELVAVANRSTHQFTVLVNGEVARIMPASMGKPGYETPVGTFPVLEKFRDLVMDSSTYGVPVDSPEGYRLDTEYAVRLTWSGIFVHAAPWSVDSQGYANVSHGCINLGTEDAQWYFDRVKIGDPVIIEG